MPKLEDKKLTIGKLEELSVKERTNFLEPIVKANTEQFTKLAEGISSVVNLAKAFSTIKFPLYDILENLKMPQMPDMSRYFENDAYVLGRIEPQVTVTKSQKEIEIETKQAYYLDLHIQLLEQQLNLVKGMQTPQYDINTGIITFLGKKIEIPLNTNLEMVCRVVLKNLSNMKRIWSWDEIVGANKDNIDRYSPRQIYTAARSVNEKVAQETQAKDFFLCKPISTVRLNPKFLAK